MFEGEIGQIDLVQRLVELGREQFTGALRFESDGIIKIIYFKGGDVLSASTNDRTDSIDEILLRAGKVTREHIKQALAKRKESETLGDALLGLGFITRKELTWARRIQVIGILRSILGWATGSFTLVADYLPKREEGTLFPLQQVLLELIVTDPDRTKFERAMDGGFSIFERSPNFDDAFRRLGLNEDAEAIVAHIDGTNTAAEIASASGKDAFNVYKLLEALRVLGLVEKPEVSPEVSAPALPPDEWTLDDEPAGTAAPAMNAFDEPPGIDLDAPTVARTSSEMPAWDDEPQHDILAATAPMPAMVPPMETTSTSELGAEPEWGFDEAQIETARRASVPMHGDEEVPVVDDVPRRKEPSNIWGALMLATLLVVIAAAGWFGWQWWQGRNAPQPALVTRPVTPPLRPAITPPASATASAPTETIAKTTPPTTTTTTTPIVAPPVTASVPPQTASIAPKPATPKPAPPRTTSSTPLPLVRPKSTTTTATATAPRLERNANGSTTITNTTGGNKPAAAAPVTAATSDANRSRYDAMAKDFAAQPNGKFTVQFEIVCETASVTKALRDGGSNVWFTSMSFRGKPCFRVFWGRYDTRDAASAAVAQLPASLRGGGASVVAIPR
jgi:septal ring-binding cell division protein DamX